jgi:protein gp37
MEESWVLKIRDKCERSGIDFFFKQWGSWGQDGIKRNKSANGRVLQGKTWDMIPVVAI